MTYVPIPIVVPEDDPSPRTRELAGLLARVISEYETHHPSVTPGEVRAALRLAQRAGGREVASQGLVVALLGGLAVLVGLVFFFLKSSGGAPESIPMIVVAIGIFAVLALLIAMKRSRM